MGIKFYLKQLTIQNFATFKNQTISFRPGLNSIVGETGSGKSLVLDALQMILGARTDKKIVRRETEFALIEATFHCQDDEMKEFLAQEGYPLESDEITIKRMIYKNGNNKNFFNYLACPLQFLNTFSRHFIDLVGQFENQKLLSESYQLKLLDQFGKIDDEVKIYKDQFLKYKKLKLEIEKALESRLSREQRLDYLNYQIQEIEKVSPTATEEDELIKKKITLLNIEKTQKLSEQIHFLLDGSDGQQGLLQQIKSLNYIFLKNQDVFANSFESSSQIEDLLFDLQDRVYRQLEMEVDPAELEGILDKIDAYQKLKKKFGGSVDSVLESYHAFIHERDSLNTLEENITDHEKEIQKLEKDLTRLAMLLHKKRCENAKLLSEQLSKRVQNLNMKGAIIKLNVDPIDSLTEYGSDKVSFEAQTNPGEGFFKVKDIASGGELSRILLAVRQILSSYDSISIFLFDEIDTGIGGETAVFIGKALSEVAHNGQVIAITHLPQIAQFSDTLIIVEKNVQNNDDCPRTESIAKQLVGKNIQKSVREMLHLN